VICAKNRKKRGAALTNLTGLAMRNQDKRNLQSGQRPCAGWAHYHQGLRVYGRKAIDPALKPPFIKRETIRLKRKVDPTKGTGLGLTTGRLGTWYAKRTNKTPRGGGENGGGRVKTPLDREEPQRKRSRGVKTGALSLWS